MAKLTVKGIQDLALELIRDSPGGIRYSDLHGRIVESSAETPPNTVKGALHGLLARFGDQIERPSRGVYRLVDVNRTVDGPESASEPEAPASVTEASYYEPFAQWLEERDEATIARALGGSAMRDKWATPDVVGVYKPLPSDLIDFPKEIIAAEIKSVGRSAVEAVGQASLYRLFSSQTYVVLPAGADTADLDRVEALTVLLGIGLVVFSGPPDAPAFEFRVRAQRFAPDMFYVNDFAYRLSRHDRKLFDALFA